MSRLSRQQMKRDEMVETVGSVVEYTRDHTRTLVGAAIALIVLVLAVGGFFVWRQQRGAEATATLAAAMAVEGDEATARERFQEVVDRFPDSLAAAVARLYLGAFAAADDDIERARELWQAVAERGAGSVLGVQARLNLWELSREQGRHDELVGELRTLLEEGKTELSRDQLLYQLALTLEARGSTGEARETYLRLVEEHPQSVLRGAAQNRADRLGGDPTDLG